MGNRDRDEELYAGEIPGVDICIEQIRERKIKEGTNQKVMVEGCATR